MNMKNMNAIEVILISNHDTIYQQQESRGFFFQRIIHNEEKFFLKKIGFFLHFFFFFSSRQVQVPFTCNAVVSLLLLLPALDANARVIAAAGAAGRALDRMDSKREHANQDDEQQE